MYEIDLDNTLSAIVTSLMTDDISAAWPMEFLNGISVSKILVELCTFELYIGTSGSLCTKPALAVVLTEGVKLVERPE